MGVGDFECMTNRTSAIPMRPKIPLHPLEHIVPRPIKFHQIKKRCPDLSLVEDFSQKSRPLECFEANSK